jgi:hypothetical protein
MLKAFLSSWVVVFLLMILLFLSVRLAMVSLMVSLTVAIVSSYGISGPVQTASEIQAQGRPFDRRYLVL